MNNELQDVTKGIGKIYTAELLKIIAAVVSIVCASITPFLNLDTEEISGGTLGLSVLVSILAWPAIILGIYALFVNLSGLGIVSKHNKKFANAFKFAIFALILTVAAGVIKSRGGEVASGIVSLVASVVYLVLMLSIISGSAELAQNSEGGDDIARLREKVRTPMVVLMIICIAGNIVLQFGSVSDMRWASLAVSLAAGLLSLGVDIIFIRFLARTREACDLGV